MNSQNNQGDHYVVDGAIFKCQYGSVPCQIAVTTNQKVKAQGKAVVTDKEVNYKVPACTFGNCTMNPNKQAPVCNYANGIWVANTTLKHGANSAITESSKMKCPIYSGEISCVYHGQTQCVSIDDFKCLGLEKLAFSPFATVLKFPDGDKAKKKITPINSVSVSREFIRPNDIVTLHAFKKGNKELTATEFCNWIVTTRKSVNDRENNKSCHLDKMTIYKTVTSPFNIILNEPGVYHLECGSDNMVNYYAGSKSFTPTNTKKTTFDYKKSIGGNNELPFDKNCETIIEVLEHNRILDIELKGEYTVDSQNVSRYFVEKDKEIEIIVTTAVPLIKNERLCLVVNGIQTTNQASPIEDNKYSFKFKTSGFNSHIEKRIDIILKDYTDITSYQIPFNCNLSKSRENEESNCKSLTIKVIDGYVSATISLDEKGERPVKDKIRPNTPIFMEVRPTDKSCSIKDLNKAVWKIKENGITSNFHGNLLWHNFKREGKVEITVDLSQCDVAIKDNKLTHSFTVARNKITGIKKSTPNIFYPNINYRIGLDFLYDDYDKIEDGSFSYLLDGEEKEIDSKEINVIFSKEETGKHYLFISKDVALDLDVKEAQIERWQFVDNNRNKISEVGFDEPFFLDIDVPAWKDLNKKEQTDQVRFCLWDKKSPIKASCLENARIGQNGQAHIKLIISKDDVNVGKREKINIIASLTNPPYTDLKNLSQMPGPNGHWICSNMPISDQISTMLTLTTVPCITGYFSGKSCNPQKSVMKYGDSIYIILSTHNCKEMMDEITVELYENNKVGDDDTLIATYDNLQADEYGKVKIDISDKFADEEAHGNNPNPRLFYFKVRSGADVVYTYPQTQEDVFNMTYRKECDECDTAVVEFDGETHTVTTSDSKAVTKVRSYLWQLKVGKDKQINELNKTLAMMAPVVVGEELRKGEKREEEDCKCPRCHEKWEDLAKRLKEMFPKAKEEDINIIAQTYCDYARRFGMDSCWIKAHFFAQAAVESTGLTEFTENLNYSTKERVKEVFQKPLSNKNNVDQTLNEIFDNVKTPSGEDRKKKLAKLVYGERKDLGNITKEEGWTYRGRGLVQITGKDAYKNVGKILEAFGIDKKNLKCDLVNNPDLVASDIKLATIASMAFFRYKNCNMHVLCNGQNNTYAVTSAVGGFDKAKKQTAFDGKDKDKDGKIIQREKYTRKIFEVDDCKYNVIECKDNCPSYHTFFSGRVEKHIPKGCDESKATHYVYYYHKEDGTVVEICTRTIVRDGLYKLNKPSSSTIPSDSEIKKNDIKTWKYPKPVLQQGQKSGIDGDTIYLMPNGDKIVSGKEGTKKYTKSGNETIELVKIDEGREDGVFEFKEDGVNLYYEIDKAQTVRFYSDPNTFAILIGILAELGSNIGYDIKFRGTGNAEIHGTGYPSVSHRNGTSLDFCYSENKDDSDEVRKIKDIALLKASIKFNCMTRLTGTWNSRKNGREEYSTKPEGDGNHNNHIHLGPFNQKINEPTIIKEN